MLEHQKKASRERRDTHSLSSADGVISQDTKRKQVGEGHSPSVECRRTDKAGHQKKMSGQGAPTDCRAQKEGQIRTLKERKQVMGTHFLSSTEGGAEVNWPKGSVRAKGKGTHFLSSAGKLGKSRHQKEASERRIDGYSPTIKYKSEH